MSIRVLLLSTDSKICGTERMILSLLSHLNRDRYTPFLVTLKGPGDLVEEAKRIDVDGVNLTMQDRSLWAGLKHWRRVVLSFRPDVFHSFLHHSNILARLTRQFVLDAPVISGIRTVYTVEDYGRLYGWLEWLTHSFDTFLVANSECGRRSLIENMKLPKRKLAVVHNGLERIESGSDPQTGRQVIRAEFGFSDADIVIGIVAQLRPPKRHDLLIESIARLKEAYPAIRLLIVGQGDIEPALKGLAHERGVSDRVVFAGYRSDARRLLQGIDVFALPSEVEGMPVSIMEAMDASLPVVATFAGGIPEVVRDGETGLLCDAGDPDTFTNSLRTVLESAALRLTMGRAGNKRVWDEFSAERMVRSFETLYSQCVKTLPCKGR